MVEKLDAIIDQAEVLESNKHDGYRTFDLHGHALIRQAIVTLLGLFKNTKDDKKHIILFEEPELYLHPSNKRKFRETLYKIAESDSYQVICVSHDPQLIDLSKPHTSLAGFIECMDGKTEIHQTSEVLFIKDEETKERIQMLNRFNPHICESFFADEVVLVEGDTEAIIVREMLIKHFPEKEIFVLNTGSKNNIPFFINVLGSFKINQHVIHDSDERHLYEKGKVVLNRDGTKRINSAWIMNDSIWTAMSSAESRNGCKVKRYVSIRNFEHAHNYVHDSKKGKPLSAFEFAKKIDFNDNSISIVNQIKKIAGVLEQDITFDGDYLEQHVKEPF
ncbi:putative ATP-dependent endonuclease, OLD family [Pantoea sp. AS-PWVM4]|uniref:ATP-dependent nuclease n=1 Tax=Pantoea sp. AS-PWVM4 TaxID=1332069 RepID=UPI0003AC6593|nr:TOPRIM nucleotidyl transferase/hydrolase domain-containing protein [Pantoea sp. AS-PWVM4]ERK11212.1 putative ATP-dependent endonuclease, OLD family [Pantoea sp. AS-PWVM4]